MIYKLSSTQQRRCLLLEQQTVYGAGKGRAKGRQQQTEGEVGRQDMRNLFSNAFAAC